MIGHQLALMLFQYSGSGGTQYGSLPVFGILIGIVAGVVASANGRSGGRWGALVGAVCFAGYWAIEFAGAWASKPEGTDPGGLVWASLFSVMGQSALSGAIWCGLWGLLGGRIGRRMRAAKSNTEPPDTTEVVQLKLTAAQAATTDEASTERAGHHQNHAD